MTIPNKILRTVTFCLTVFAVSPVFSQQEGAKPSHETPPPPILTKFDLDFPGGTPDELVAAIQKAMGRPLNAIVPTQFANVKLPALKMKGVDAVQFFYAMLQASSSKIPSPYGGYFNSSFGFRSDGPGPRSDDSVWYFTGEFPLPPEKLVRFYLLTPYLDQGLTVDDITTAIQTGWKMLSDSNTSEISFHKETKLLIAVGDSQHLQVIEQALQALKTPKVKPAAAATDKPEEQKKGEK